MTEQAPNLMNVPQSPLALTAYAYTSPEAPLPGGRGSCAALDPAQVRLLVQALPTDRQQLLERVVGGIVNHVRHRWNAATVDEEDTLNSVASEPSHSGRPFSDAPDHVRVTCSFTVAGGLCLEYEWPGAVGPVTARSFMDAVVHLLRHAVVRPESALSALSLSDGSLDDELRQLAAGGCPCPATWSTVPEAVCEHGLGDPGRPAVRDESATYTYGQLIQAAERTASALHRAGASRGDHVLVSGPQSYQAVVAALGVMLAGAVYVPVDESMPAARLAEIVSRTGAVAWLLQNDGTIPPASSMLAGLTALHVSDIIKGDDPASERQAPPPDLAADDMAYVLFTSGTTGIPKGITVPHRCLAHFCREITGAYEMSAHDRVLAFARTTFDVSIFEVFASLVAGCCVVVASAECRMDPYLLQNLMIEEAVSLAELPPSLVPMLDAEALPSLRLLSLGGEAVPGSVVNAWARPGREVWNGYGPTETTVAVTLARLSGTWLSAPPIGRPLPGVRAYIVDADLRLVPRGMAGELCIAGESVAAGYLGDPERTAQAFVALPAAPGERVYRTGDLVRWREDDALDFLGRVDRQVKINGFRVELSEVEHCLMQAPGIGQAVAEVVPLPAAGTVLVALVVPEQGELDESAVLKWVGQALPAYAVPSRLHSVNALPVTGNGKVDRKAVRQLLTCAWAPG